MNQRITLEQYKELTEIQHINYCNFATEKKWYKEGESKKIQWHLWSIVQMIEFLDLYGTIFISCAHSKKHIWIVNGIEDKELATALWQVVKEKLC